MNIGSGMDVVWSFVLGKSQHRGKKYGCGNYNTKHKCQSEVVHPVSLCFVERIFHPRTKVGEGLEDVFSIQSFADQLGPGYMITGRRSQIIKYGKANLSYMLRTRPEISYRIYRSSPYPLPRYSRFAGRWREAGTGNLFPDES